MVKVKPIFKPSSAAQPGPSLSWSHVCRVGSEENVSRPAKENTRSAIIGTIATTNPALDAGSRPAQRGQTHEPPVQHLAALSHPHTPPNRLPAQKRKY
jgi:hypothetical protein